MHSRRIFAPLIRFVDIFPLRNQNKTKKATSRIFYPRWWPSENLPKRPQAGPDTVTKIIMLLTRIGGSAMRRGRDRVGFAFDIAYVQSTVSVWEMQGAIGINKFYRTIRRLLRKNSRLKANVNHYCAELCSPLVPPWVTPNFGSFRIFLLAPRVQQ